MLFPIGTVPVVSTIGHGAYQWQPRKFDWFLVAVGGQRNRNDKKLKKAIIS